MTKLESGQGPLLSVKNLAIEVNTSGSMFPAVREISFDLPRSSSVALVGESGSGKTLTALSIAGLLPKNLSATGVVSMDGLDLLGASAAVRRSLAGTKIGYIFQEPMSALHPVLPVGQQVAEALRAHQKLKKVQIRDRVFELFTLVGLTDVRNLASNRIGQLSGGMCQRVMIAMAIACEPDLLIADEPTTALDVTLQRQVTDLLLSLKERMGLSLLLVTHDLGVVSDTCENVVVVYAGQAVEVGTAASILGDPQHDYTRSLMEAIPRLGDTRKRLPTPKENAPWLKDVRHLPESTWAPSYMKESGPGHFVRIQEGGNS